MTTVAFDGRFLAVDSRVSRSYGYHTKMCKLFKLADGSFFTGCGNAEDLPAVAKWLNSFYGETDKVIDKPKVHENFNALRVYLEGKRIVCDQFEAGLTPYRMLSPALAIGSGGDFAVSAMDFGNDAGKAVAFACRHSSSTGLPVYVGDVKTGRTRVIKHAPKQRRN